MRPLLGLILLLNLPISLAVGGPIDASYFSSRYEEARTRFLQALWSLQKAGLRYEHTSLKIPSKLETELFVDAAYLPATGEKKHLLILSSGVHGSEAPLGSAILLYFLRQTLPRLDRTHVGVLILHSLNPYGHVTGRRVTENNVDLNRNFVLAAEDFNKLANPAYDQYRDFLAPHRSVDNVTWEAAKIFGSMIVRAAQGSATRQKIRQAFAGGQYAHEKGIYFGGKNYEPQVPWVDSILKNLEKYEEVLHYDIHTGLGHERGMQLISGLETRLDAPNVLQLKHALGGLDGVSLASPESEGLYVTSGDFIDFTHSRLAGQNKFASFTAEFGTLGDGTFPQIATSIRMILENRGQHWGFGSRSGEQRVRHHFAELFNPQSLEWRRRALYLGVQSLEQILGDALPATDFERKIFDTSSQ